MLHRRVLSWYKESMRDIWREYRKISHIPQLRQEFLKKLSPGDIEAEFRNHEKKEPLLCDGIRLTTDYCKKAGLNKKVKSALIRKCIIGQLKSGYILAEMEAARSLVSLRLEEIPREIIGITRGALGDNPLLLFHLFKLLERRPETLGIMAEVGVTSRRFSVRWCTLEAVSRTRIPMAGKAAELLEDDVFHLIGRDARRAGGAETFEGKPLLITLLRQRFINGLAERGRYTIDEFEMFLEDSKSQEGLYDPSSWESEPS